MASNKWHSTSNADRKRKRVQFTLSDEAIEALERLAAPGRRSEFVERLILSVEREQQ